MAPNEFHTRIGLRTSVWLCGCVLGVWVSGSLSDAADGDSTQQAPSPAVEALVRSYCIDCHSHSEAISGLDLESMMGDGRPIEQRLEVWEKVVQRLRSRQMPPSDSKRPEETEYLAALDSLESALDAHALEHPMPGRTDTFRRLTRFEYRNAIRDLLNVDVDVSDLLPADEVSHGFDNITVGELSPTLLNRYISAAQQICRLALGRPVRSPAGKTVRVKPDITQEEHVEGLPLGTRGGVIVPYNFPRDGEYEIRIRLTRDRNEHVEGLSQPHEVELLLDLEEVETFTVKPPRGGAAADEWSKPTHENVDQHLNARIRVSAGPHEVGVTFLKNPSSLLETKRQPLNVHYNMYRHPRLGPAIYQVSITGPYESEGQSRNGAGESPSRERILVVTPSGPDDEDACAREILSVLMRRAYRKPLAEEDFVQPMALYRQTRDQGGDFEEGVEMALCSVLMNPQFLFRVERDPEGLAPGVAYRISDVELASRLSFFLWSSIPDDELLDLAERRMLSRPEVLIQQTQRMLADEKSSALVKNFGGQWLYLRNLESITPDLRFYPDFDDNLRQAFREETELFLASVVRENRSVLDLLDADYTYLNERLAKHYGIPHVYGSRFRRVDLGEDSHRGGLLRQGSILTVTSYATRTSPVIRGKWILENLLGTPPPPPPPDVPSLEASVSAHLPVRERLAQHRADPACASCHDLIDPVGFSLENFDALGRWREIEEGQPVDARGGLPDGSQFRGVEGLERALVARPVVFVGTLAEKLLTYAVGRGLTPDDAPTIRGVVRSAEEDQYRFASLIVGIVESTPFQMRMSK